VQADAADVSGTVTENDPGSQGRHADAPLTLENFPDWQK
jgi:hypothetical protein